MYGSAPEGQLPDERLALLTRLSLRIGATLEVAAVLEEVVIGACILTEARYGALGVFDHEGRLQQFITHGLSEAQRNRIGALPQGRGILGLLHRLQRPLRIDNLAEHPDAAGFPPHHPPMRTFVGVPIRYGDEELGNLYLAEKTANRVFTEADEQVLMLFAAQAGMAIHNARLHERVERERRRLEAVLQTSPIGVIVAARDGEIHLVNEEGRRLTGPVTPAAGRPLSDTPHRRSDGSPFGPDESPWHRALDRGETVRAAEVLLQTFDGGQIPALINAAPLLDEQGAITEAVVTVQDISHLKEVERLKDEFLSMVSHDLKSPLTVIKGLATSALLSAGEAEDVVVPRQWAAAINAEVDWLTELVDNLLDLSRLESGSLPLDVEECYLTDLVEDSIQHFLQLPGQAAREVLVEVPASLPPLQADYGQLKRVLLNLLTNAAKYSDAGTPIAVRGYVSGPGQVTLAVEDQGMGLTPEEQERVFEKFYRSPRHTRARTGADAARAGSGLGLAVCRAIARAHGGDVWVKSEPGRGSVFGIDLPASQ